jgi:hypothetical protein
MSHAVSTATLAKRIFVILYETDWGDFFLDSLFSACYASIPSGVIVAIGVPNGHPWSAPLLCVGLVFLIQCARHCKGLLPEILIYMVCSFLFASMKGVPPGWFFLALGVAAEVVVCLVRLVIRAIVRGVQRCCDFMYARCSQPPVQVENDGGTLREEAELDADAAIASFTAESMVWDHPRLRAPGWLEAAGRTAAAIVGPFTVYGMPSGNDFQVAGALRLGDDSILAEPRRSEAGRTVAAYIETARDGDCGEAVCQYADLSCFAGC